MIECKTCGLQSSDADIICARCHSMLASSESSQETKTEKITSRKPPPSLAEKAKNFISATTAHAMDGFKITSEEERNKRFSICEACEYFNKSNTTCDKCGCYLEKKTAWRTSSCPIGKWGPEEVKSEGGIVLPYADSPTKKCGGCGKKS